MTTSVASRTSRDDEASASCAGHCGITQSSPRIMNTLAVGSGADVGRFPHWTHPGGGASSSAMSTTAWSPAAGIGVGDADAGDAAATVVAAATPTSRCGPVTMAVSRGGSPDAAALTVSRGALDECRLVGTDASDLSTLAGARAGTIGVTLRTGNTRVSFDPSKSRMHWGNAAHLKLEKPRFLFLEGPGGAVFALAGATVALAGTSAALAGSSADNPAVGASTRPVVTGAGDSTSQGGPTPRHSPPPPPTTMSSPVSPGGGGSPCCSRS
jgi:hypothetical protein